MDIKITFFSLEQLIKNNSKQNRLVNIMALKIKNQLGNDQGITAEAYVRINTYRIDKQQGNLELNYSTYFNEDAAKSVNQMNMLPMNRTNSQPIHNIKLGEYFNISLRKEITGTTTTMQMQPVQKEVTRETETTIDGVTTTGKTTTMESVMKEVAVVNEYKTSVVDLSILDGVNVFEYSYGKLKEKLLVYFDDIEDC